MKESKFEQSGGIVVGDLLTREQISRVRALIREGRSSTEALAAVQTKVAKTSLFSKLLAMVKR